MRVFLVFCISDPFTWAFIRGKKTAKNKTTSSQISIHQNAYFNNFRILDPYHPQSAFQENHGGDGPFTWFKTQITSSTNSSVLCRMI